VTILKFISKLLVISPAVFLLSCGPSGEAGSDEGSIEFATKPIDEKHPLFGLAPSSATLKYKKEKFALEMTSMGMFHTAIIGDIEAKTITQTVKFLDIKQACIETEKDILAENKDFALKIEETNETKDIIGLKSYKIKVTMANDPNITFDAWYTKDLGMEDCNCLNPYSQIKGVLLDYRVKKMGMEMHFVATSRKKVAISEKTFEIPSHMTIVDKVTMAKNFTN
jgi:ribosomal 30S subunit maturation factor RimM